MSGPITNHTFGTMQHAEYEAQVRKHRSPKAEQNRGLNLDILGKVMTLIQKAQTKIRRQPNAELATNS